jgi:2-polyprenyl-6-methoxyphenol hydroxylase-like FAD-dependent oxidoreductase
MPLHHDRKHAIVIGGSMAGLLATRVLADHYQQVTLVERDAFPPQGENRRGVPQGRHTHGLLASGRQVLDRLFPGISEELVAGGAVSGDIVGQGRWFNEGGCHVQFASGLEGLLMSRPYLESKVRARVLALANVQNRQSCDATGLLASADNRRVTGIRTASEAISADMILDASGRGSHSPQWLEAIGYAKPQEERVEIALGYASRFFRRHSQDLNGDMAVIIPPTPHGRQGGVMLAQEGDRWTVTLVSHFGNYAPMELDGFREFARNLPAPFIYDTIRNAEPLGDPATARFPASVRRRYEKMQSFPEGYLVFGDAISSFNPVYGQGMSVAALEAMELDAVLREGSENLAQRFFLRAAKVVDIPWSIAVGNDLRMPETTGPRNAGVTFINWYMERLHQAAHHDPVASLAFHRVANLLAPPPSVMHPRIAMRVLLGNLRRHPKAADSPRSMGAVAGQ